MRPFSIPIILLATLGAALIFWSVRVATKPTDSEVARTTTVVRRAKVVPAANRSDAVESKLADTAPVRSVKENSVSTSPENSSAQSSLLAAALAQNWGTVRQLVAAGAAVDLGDRLGFTPMMAAAMHGNAEVVQLFLDNHAAPDAVDVSRRSALDYAIASRHAEAANVLIPVTKNFDAIASRLIQFALTLDETDLAKVLLNRVSVALDWNKETRHALNQAVADGDNEYVHVLLSKHLAPLSDNGNVPLIAEAIATGNDALFATLLACGADPNTVLPSPCDQKFCETLSSKSLRNYIAEDKGVTLLMIAAGLGRDDYVQMLLNAGADRNRSTAREKMLALYFASNSESWKCLQALLGSGPQPEKLRVEINLTAQRATVIKEGVTIFTTECSTGRKGFATPAGQYVITDKDLSHRSTIYKVPMPYFMRLNCRDFGMHEGVTSSHYASHGCIRLPSSAARRLFTELPVGTVVHIN